ncbi:hypothetical protein IQ13_1374 [Lacibacter cauensis]|uniref:Cro/C1-type helix-turn-helix DNA-binding protein n=2 Tax=Lacibacter cauensis TaxID=510947 RepID=A0A562SR32_9BACT|nr:hypothetical protein IQ13_1374 [Lacibacter cauensis]
MFLANTVSKMKDIEEIEPTNIAKALGINHSRYIAKLNNPEEFKFKHIQGLANLLNIDIQIIIDVIKKELAQVKKKAR